MNRFLVLCPRDWLDPQAGKEEEYVHEIFTRIASRGHYVAWLAHRPLRLRRGECLPRVKIVDGIQIARLGARRFYRSMAKLFLARLVKTGKMGKDFTIIVDCVTDQPLPIADYTGVPVVPIIFNLRGGLRASDDLPGPLIAASTRARDQLRGAGVPANYVVSAPFGVCSSRYRPREDTAGLPRLAALSHRPRHVLRALRMLAKKAPRPGVDLIGCRPPLRRYPDLRHYPCLDENTRDRAYREAALAYCGKGLEHEALKLSACGVPVICPATPEGREYVYDGKTGFLYTPGSTRELAGRLHQLLEDDALRERLGAQGRRMAEARSWDRTASLVLATFENL